MSKKPVIYWFRNDLRLHDNPALLHAIKSQLPVIPVFIFDDLWYKDPCELNFPRTGLHRKTFMAESLADLNMSVERAGNHLLVFSGNPVNILSRLFRFFDAEKIIAQKEYAFEEIRMEEELKAKTNLELVWGSILYQPDQVSFPPEKTPFYFTRFKNKVLQEPFMPEPVKTIRQIKNGWSGDIPKQLLPFDYTEWAGAKTHSVFRGGETAGLKRMKEYFDAGGPFHYSNTRNKFEGPDFSSQVSPWLANGALSPRSVFVELQRMEKQFPDKEEPVRTLSDQLIWRDYFRYLFLRYGKKLFTTKGLRKTEPDMYNDIDGFEQWRKGETGEPLIDALMHEIAETGYMSNRGRMLVSFYLSKEMKINWQWGAAWFESTLIDYDVCSNYGNWAYQSGRGTDGRVNRRFNLATQAKKFDPDGSFVKKWL